MQDYDVNADVESKFAKIRANLMAENHITPQKEPIVILLGRQPGAGKSFGTLEMSKRLNFDLLIINGDVFRTYLQHYNFIYQNDGKEAAKYT
ncbi:zeta toxin family protein, partial [Glaesserella parasuis]|nr:zeta toxin family protein [Glaesserella parasuis]